MKVAAEKARDVIAKPTPAKWPFQKLNIGELKKYAVDLTSMNDHLTNDEVRRRAMTGDLSSLAGRQLRRPRPADKKILFGLAGAMAGAAGARSAS